MATYLELYDLQNDNELLHTIAVAVAVAAEAVRTEDAATANHAARLVWAREAFANPVSVGRQALWAVLAVNKDNTVAHILGATDAQVQTAVDDVVDLMAGG